MKSIYLISAFLLLSATLVAQDTIFVKNGQVIPAVIVEKGEVEIKYKKFGQPEPAAIYSVFVRDIVKIHYKDGIISDNSLSGKGTGENGTVRWIDFAGTNKSTKYSIGMGAGHFSRVKSDELLEFWQFITGDNTAEIYGNPLYFPITFRVTYLLDAAGRNWLGGELQLLITPSDAINAKNDDGSSIIELKSTYFNTVMFYGHTLNHQGTIAAIFELGIDYSRMSGYIKYDNTTYDVSGSSGGFGFHMGSGIDCVISKRIMASARVGYMWSSFEESHKSSTSSSGYSSFYTNPTVSEDMLTVKWNGPFATLGLFWSFYGKMKL